MPFEPVLLPSLDEINSLFEYNSGKLLNKINRKQSRQGEEAGYIHKDTGYRKVKINGKGYLVHRVIFYIHTGLQPSIVDHINGDIIDNRIENLREATCNQNMYNRQMNKNNKSGVKGIYWSSAKNKWVAMLGYNGKQRTLGHFDSKDLADEFLSLARELIHGDFSNHGTP